MAHICGDFATRPRPCHGPEPLSVVSHISCCHVPPGLVAKLPDARYPHHTPYSRHDVGYRRHQGQLRPDSPERNNAPPRLSRCFLETQNVSLAVSTCTSGVWNTRSLREAACQSMNIVSNDPLSNSESYLMRNCQPARMRDLEIRALPKRQRPFERQQGPHRGWRCPRDQESNPCCMSVKRHCGSCADFFDRRAVGNCEEPDEYRLKQR